MAKNILEVRQLTKTFDQRGLSALSKLDLTLKKSQGLILLGPSGHGKSTLLKILANIEQADLGEITWRPQQAKIVLAENSWPYSKETSLIEACNHLLQLDQQEDERLINLVRDLLDQFSFEYREEIAFQHLSAGMQQRAILVLALAQKPDVLLLDESFNHLDHELARELRTLFFHSAAQQKLTWILATHQLSDLELCHQAKTLNQHVEVAYLYAGKIQQQGTLDDLALRPANIWVAQGLGVIQTIACEVRQEEISPAGTDLKVSGPFGSFIARCAHKERQLADYVLVWTRPQHIVLRLLSAEKNQMSEINHLKILGEAVVVDIQTHPLYGTIIKICPQKETSFYLKNNQALTGEEREKMLQLSESDERTLWTSILPPSLKENFFSLGDKVEVYAPDFIVHHALSL